MEEKVKDNVATKTDEGKSTQGAEAQEEIGVNGPFGKFKNADALLKAYDSLEAEFTRRSQRLKELEKNAAKNKDDKAEVENVVPFAPVATPVDNGDELYKRASADEGVKNRIIAEYLLSVGKGAVPLISAGGGVVTPAERPKNFSEAGALALGYFKSANKG